MEGQRPVRRAGHLVVLLLLLVALSAQSFPLNNFDSGTQGAPSRAYRVDPQLGSYRIQQGNEGFTADGVLRWHYSTSLLHLTSGVDLFVGGTGVFVGVEVTVGVELGVGVLVLVGVRVAVAVNAINYAFLAMVNRATDAAVVMKNFALATGLSADELQRWRAAADPQDVDAKELDQTISSLQKQMAEIQRQYGK